VIHVLFEVVASVLGCVLAFQEIQDDCESIASDQSLIHLLKAAICIKLAISFLYAIGFGLTMCVSS